MKIAFTNGCFDILHLGHIEMLRYAKSLADELVVGIDSDRRIGEKKGKSRPINDSNSRMAILNAIRYVDKVSVFDTDEELIHLVQTINPDIMIIGSDWQGKKVIGSEYAKEIHFFKRIPQYSTTKTIESIAFGRVV